MAPSRIPRLRRETAVVFAGLLFLLGVEFLGLFRWTDDSLYDFGFRLRGPAAVDPTILVVAVDEPTLAALGRWPLKRSHYARLLEIAGNARAIGFDIIMVEPTEDDPLLGEAARRHGRVVLPA